MTMLNQAFKKIPDNTELILHSDQGWQYRMAAYHQALEEKGIRQSMSRKATCWDNAVMENFFGHLKSELLYNQEFESVNHFVQELHAYLEYDNQKRIRKKLNYMSSYRIQAVDGSCLMDLQQIMSKFGGPIQLVAQWLLDRRLWETGICTFRSDTVN